MTKGSTGSIRDRAMIVYLNVQHWTAKVSDKKIRQGIAERHGADPRMLKAIKSIIDPDALAEIRSAKIAAYAVRDKWTSPWNDGGYRILSSANFYKFTEELNKTKDDFFRCIEAFIPAWEHNRARAEELLGPDLYETGDYPKSADDLKAKFHFVIRITPIPSGEDFRVQGLSGVDAAAIRQEAEADVKAAMEVSNRDNFRRLHESVEHMIERIAAFNAKGKGNCFRDSVVANMRELVDILPSLNVVGDPKLMKANNEIRRKLLVSPEAIRTDDGVRTKTVEDAEKILRKLEDFI